MSEQPERGICDFRVVHVVTTYTSGNELRGTPVLFGKYDSAMDARQALADDGFTNGQFGWRKYYTTASVSKETEYDNFRADLIQQARAEAYAEALDAAAVAVAPKRKAKKTRGSRREASVTSPVSAACRDTRNQASKTIRALPNPYEVKE